MGRKLLEKAGLVGLPISTTPLQRPEDPSVAGTDAARPRTAPGTMLGFMTAQSAAIQESEQLRLRLAAFDGAAPARRLDPATVRPSQWANRHEASYQDESFAQLKADIASAGGNVQAIKVRPLAAAAGDVGKGVGPSNPPTAPAVPDGFADTYEIVYGHRRHRACLELGLPVLAVVEPVSEQRLFEDMERENRARKDLSAWEQGAMYARALDQGLYPSNRQLALAIGRDLGDVGKALALARLPQPVIEAFASPLELQFRWAKPLADALQRDPEGLLARAASLKARRPALKAKEVFEGLLGRVGADSDAGAADVVSTDPPPAAELVIKVGRRAVATVAGDAAGRTLVRIDQTLDDARRAALALLIRQFLSS